MTRLDYIWDVLGDRFSYKSRPIFGDFWGYFDKHEFVNKNEFVLLENFGLFLCQHLVTWMPVNIPVMELFSQRR